MHSVITLTTDFGYKDVYVASVKGVILSINPKSVIVDICHSIEPQNILRASFVFSTAYKYFPKGTIHIVVVDPGVGSERSAIILKTPSALFIAPDNGVLSHVIQDLSYDRQMQIDSNSTTIEIGQLGSEVEAIAITNPEYWLQEISTTFHGRDIFAPVAAQLSLGVPLHRFGEKVDCINYFSMPQPSPGSSGELIGNIRHIDNFGNIITNVREKDLKRNDVVIKIGNESIEGISKYYAQKSGLAAIIGSSGYLEISFTNGNAADYLKINNNDVFVINAK